MWRRSKATCRHCTQLSWSKKHVEWGAGVVKLSNGRYEWMWQRYDISKPGCCNGRTLARHFVTRPRSVATDLLSSGTAEEGKKRQAEHNVDVGGGTKQASTA